MIARRTRSALQRIARRRLCTTAAQPPPQPAFIVDVDVSNYHAVLGDPRPVILDCWAEWCEPCKQLTPALEQYATQAKGSVLLAKLDVEANKEIAGELQIKVLPTVFGIHAGKLIDKFEGLPEQNDLVSFVGKLISAAGATMPPAPVSAEEAASDPASIYAATMPALRSGAMTPDAAGAELERVIALIATKAEEELAAGKTRRKMLSDEDKAEKTVEAQARCGLAEIALAQGDVAGAESVIAALREHVDSSPKTLAFVLVIPEVENTTAMVAIASTAARATAPVDELRARCDADATDREAALCLGAALVASQGAGGHREASEILLKLVKVERGEKAEAQHGKALLLELMKLVDRDERLRISKKLANLLF